VTSQPPIRIGNRERESACRALDEHLAEGRLDMDEYADRYAKATLARVQDELDELFVDLPRPHATLPAVTLEKEPPRRAREWGGLVAVARLAALVLAVLIAVPVLAAWWVLWMVVPMVMCRGRYHARWAGPRPWVSPPRSF
jgi:Domain of unknown function (DUF1707)